MQLLAVAGVYGNLLPIIGGFDFRRTKRIGRNVAGCGLVSDRVPALQPDKTASFHAKRVSVDYGFVYALYVWYSR